MSKASRRAESRVSGRASGPVIYRPSHPRANENGMVPRHLADTPSRHADGPMVISDDLRADLEHHGFSDGRRTASKSVFRRWTRECGGIERGNDRGTRRRAEPLDARDDVGRAINMLRQGYKPHIVPGQGWD